ncbi:MAG: exodeoxyribonuclease VII small subunit [Holosporaceae bacterium]|jgi:exodeoxyribonuclease VII small subunit|nr:exodeoxyribonuclease VII small subunit [Holosporaceae bacterium]
MSAQKEINKMEFEEALGELETIVKTLEEGKSSLKDSVNLYERGTMLKKHCDEILESVQLRINQISSDKDGNLKIEPSEMEL